MGLPLIQALLGSEAVIYSAPFIALLNFLQWTYGVSVLTGQKGGLTLRKTVTNPILLSLAAGLACFYLRITLPDVLSTTVSSVAAMNSPAAMIILGVYLAQTDLRSLFTAPRLYANAAVPLALHLFGKSHSHSQYRHVLLAGQFHFYGAVYVLHHYFPGHIPGVDDFHPVAALLGEV